MVNEKKSGKKKGRCVEWVGAKCVSWEVADDGRLQADINFGMCSRKEKSAIEQDMGKIKGLRIKIRDVEPDNKKPPEEEEEEEEEVEEKHK